MTLIENTKTRVSLCVYSDSDKNEVTKSKHLGYRTSYEVTHQLCFELNNEIQFSTMILGLMSVDCCWVWLALCFEASIRER
jgi:hypothetical protein